MMYPILCNVQYEVLRLFRHRDIWVQISFSIFLNWIVAPFLMVCNIIGRSASYLVRSSLLTHSSLPRHGHSSWTNLVSEKASYSLVWRVALPWSVFPALDDGGSELTVPRLGL